jgi:hypothetical protein
LRVSSLEDEAEEEERGLKIHFLNSTFVMTKLRPHNTLNT